MKAFTWEVWASIICDPWPLSQNAFLVPSGPPRGVEAETVNASAVRVKWRAPAPEKQHGQIRGYQVHFVRMNYGEPQGQPFIKDILIEDTQVTTHRFTPCELIFHLALQGSALWMFNWSSRVLLCHEVIYRLNMWLESYLYLSNEEIPTNI